LKGAKENGYEIRVNSLLHKNVKEMLLQKTIDQLRAKVIRREKCVQKQLQKGEGKGVPVLSSLGTSL
jgi:hypothetical protein